MFELIQALARDASHAFGVPSYFDVDQRYMARGCECPICGHQRRAWAKLGIPL